MIKDAEEQTADGAAAGKKKFNLFSLVFLVLLVLYIIAILSYDKSDLAILEGGVEGIETNLIGNLGAWISRAVFYLFGLSVYPIGILLIFSVLRSFIPFPLKREGYAGFLLSASFGILLLYAMYPDAFLNSCIRHGLGREFYPEMNLSGGVLGAFLAAPPVMGREFDLEPGLFRKYIGETGTLIAALAFLLPGVIMMFIQDWFPMFRHFFPGIRKNETAPAPAEVPIHIQTGSPEPPETREEAPAAGADQPSFLKKAGGFLRKAYDFFSPAREEIPETQAEDVPVVPATGSPVSAPDSPVAPPPGYDDPPVAPPQTVPQPAAESPAAPPPFATIRSETESPVAPPPGMAPEPQQAVSCPVQEEEKPVAPPPVVPSAPSAPAREQTPVSIIQFSREKNKYDNEKTAADSGAKTVSDNMDCPDFVRPLPSMLDKQKEKEENEDEEHIRASRDRIQQTLESFSVDGHVSDIIVGPRVTRFEIMLEAGVKVEKITGIKNNIAMDLEAKSIRILAPIPGKNAVGIEVPNKVSSIVYIRSLLESSAWKDSHAAIPIILGRDIAGKVMVTDLAKAPHLLIAGSTGSGKSVCMNSLIMSLLFKFSPAELRLIMVDPKVVELEMYRPIPHLITPVVNDPKKVPLALRWGVNEMERRYRVLAKVKAKNLAGFNSRPPDPAPVLDENNEVIPPKLPFIIIIIDELADIMMTDAKSDVETSICRIAQKGRAAGVHLVIATQTPRKDVITGLIKANLPTKIAFKVVSNMDSRVILDAGGAETLLGYGDMLFLANGGAGMERIQGSMVSDPEIQRVVDFVAGQMEQHFNDQVVAEDVEIHDGSEEEDPKKSARPRYEVRTQRWSSGNIDPTEEDVDDIIQEVENENSIAAKYLQPGDPELLRKALEIILTEQKASTSYLQRRLGIGYNKSAELMDMLEKRGVISAPLPGGQKREILVTDGLEQQ